MLRAAAAAFLATAAALAVPVHAGTAADHGVQPWTETIASVTEFEPATRLFREAGDWQLRLRGQVKPSELAYWNLPDSASAAFELWCAPQAVSGCIRFVRFDGNEEPPEPARSNFGIPLNYTPQIKRAAAALQPVLPGETGRVEVMQIEGFTGADFSHRASPPNLGWLSVRYPVNDLSGYRAALQERGVPLAYDGEEVEIAGIGRVEIFAVRDPDGNLTEFYHAP